METESQSVTGTLLRNTYPASPFYTLTNTNFAEQKKMRFVYADSGLKNQ